MVLLDIDHFKAVNDTHGHLAGDQVLRAVAGIIRSQLRDYDIAGRYGGEEFAVLLPHTQPGQARRIAERLRMAVAAARLTASTAGGPGTGLRVTVSAGVACLADCGPELHALIAAADAALYDAKAAGRNRVRTWRGQPPGLSASARDETPGTARIPARQRAVPLTSSNRICGALPEHEGPAAGGPGPAPWGAVAACHAARKGVVLGLGGIQRSVDLGLLLFPSLWHLPDVSVRRHILLAGLLRALVDTTTGFTGGS